MYIREKAIQLRVERDLTIDEIAKRLALAGTTVLSWVTDIPLKRQRKGAAGRAVEATKAKHQTLRDEAYALGVAQWEEAWMDLIRQEWTLDSAGGRGV